MERRHADWVARRGALLRRESPRVFVPASGSPGGHGLAIATRNRNLFPVLSSNYGPWRTWASAGHQSALPLLWSTVLSHATRPSAPASQWAETGAEKSNIFRILLTCWLVISVAVYQGTGCARRYFPSPVHWLEPNIRYIHCCCYGIF